MDAYFPKTRRPIAISLKRSIPPPHSVEVTPPKAKLIAVPKDKPKKLVPPPAPRKKSRPKPVTFRKLFESTAAATATPEATATRPLELPRKFEITTEAKVDNGPLKGISTSLLELVRAKEAALKNVSPEQERRRELLGIAPDIARIVPTIFTASKKDIISHDKILEHCFKSLKMNYTTSTIDECLNLMDTIAPEWISTVSISRGKFMRLNRDNYSIPQLIDAIDKYKKRICL